jgi:hypothetical protein
MAALLGQSGSKVVARTLPISARAFSSSGWLVERVRQWNSPVPDHPRYQVKVCWGWSARLRGSHGERGGS